jgi:hypothetical protein
MYPRTDAVEFLQQQQAPVRTLPIANQIGPNMPAVYGLQDARLYDAQVDRPYHQFLSHLGCFGSWRIVREPNMRFCSVAGIRYLWGAPGWAPDPAEEAEIVYEDDASTIWRNNAALPLAYVSHQWRAVASPEEAYSLLAQEDFPCKSTVTVEPEAGRDIPPCPEHETRAFPQATLLEHLPRSVTVAVPGGSAGLLVLNDCYFPGWKAFVGEEERRILRVNGTFRGVFVEPGDERVVFKYAPASFGYGLILSLAGVLIFLFVLLQVPRAIRRVFGAKERQAR